MAKPTQKWEKTDVYRKYCTLLYGSYRDCREPSFPNLIAIPSSHLKVWDMSLTISYSTEERKSKSKKYTEKVL